jgi:hypothetical protein
MGKHSRVTPANGAFLDRYAEASTTQDRSILPTEGLRGLRDLIEVIPVNANDDSPYAYGTGVSKY